MAEIAIVVTSGATADPAQRDQHPDAIVIAADSGIDAAHALGLRVHVAVGDFDSVSPEGLERAQAEGATLERHPADKDATDLELALDVAVARGCRHITVWGSAGGRLDHLVGGLLVLASPKYADVAISASLDGQRIGVARSGHPVLVRGEPGDLVSLLAVGGPATVTTSGLRWALRGGVLEPGTSLGISNELVERHAEVSVETGTVLVVEPLHK